GRDVTEVQADRRKEQREGNGQSDDHRGANIPEEDEQDERHQDDAFREVVHHRVSCQVYEVAPVKMRHDFHAGRQEVIVQLVDLRVNGFERRISVGALPQEHDPSHDVVVVEDVSVGAVDRLTELAESNLCTLFDGCNIAHTERGAVFGGEDGSPDVVDRCHLTHGADIDQLEA